MTPLALIIIAAYLLGSISSAVLICRLYRLPDPRDCGSGNPGATNVLRLGGKTAASIVLVCDILKGMIPVWLSYFLGLNPFLLGIIAISACLGHIYPIFFHFRGERGCDSTWNIGTYRLGFIGNVDRNLARSCHYYRLFVIRLSHYSPYRTTIYLVDKTRIYHASSDAFLLNYLSAPR